MSDLLKIVSCTQADLLELCAHKPVTAQLLTAALNGRVTLTVQAFTELMTADGAMQQQYWPVVRTRLFCLEI